MKSYPKVYTNGTRNAVTVKFGNGQIKAVAPSETVSDASGIVKIKYFFGGWQSAAGGYSY